MFGRRCVTYLLDCLPSSVSNYVDLQASVGPLCCQQVSLMDLAFALSFIVTKCALMQSYFIIQFYVMCDLLLTSRCDASISPKAREVFNESINANEQPTPHHATCTFGSNLATLKKSEGEIYLCVVSKLMCALIAHIKKTNKKIKWFLLNSIFYSD